MFLRGKMQHQQIISMTNQKWTEPNLREMTFKNFQKVTQIIERTDTKYFIGKHQDSVKELLQEFLTGKRVFSSNYFDLFAWKISAQKQNGEQFRQFKAEIIINFTNYFMKSWNLSSKQ